MLTCHKIIGRHGAQSNDMVVRSVVTFDTYGTGTGENGKILLRFSFQSRDLIAENMVRFS